MLPVKLWILLNMVIVKVSFQDAENLFFSHQMSVRDKP